MSSYYFGSSTTTPSNDNKNIGKTKISVSILGDAFVDLFCYLNDGSSTNGGSLPQLGADVRVNQPGKDTLFPTFYVLYVLYVLYELA